MVDVSLKEKVKFSLFFTSVFCALFLSRYVAQIPSYVPTNDLLCWWPLNGNAQDLSQNNLSGSCFNTTSTYDRFGNPCSALACNGIELGGGSTILSNSASFNIGQNAYTINLWFKPNNLTQVTRCLFNTDPHTGIGIAFNDNNAPGYLVYDIGPANAFWNSLYNHGTFNSFQSNVWYCMTFVKNGSDYSIYINGVLEHTTNLPISASYNYNVSWRLSGISDLYQIFHGDLDDFGFWNRALSQSEINALYQATFSVLTPVNSINAGLNQTVCAGSPVTLTATGAATYSWSGGIQNGLPFVPAASGTYIVSGTTTNGCSGSDTVVITVNSNPTILSNITNSLCNGVNNGSIDISVSNGTSPYTILWSTGQTASILQSLGVGSYGVQVIDSNGCSATDTIQISQPLPMQIVSSVVNPTCSNQNNGLIDVIVAGGTPAYSYSWSNGNSTQDLNYIGAGSYTLTVNDAFGCTQTASFTLTAPPPLSITFNANTISCFGAPTGQINSIVTGGVTPYSYYWNNGSTMPNLTNVAAGNYTLLINDAGGCSSSASSIVQQPSNPLVISANISPINCFGANTGAIDVTVAGGTMFYSYAWSNGANTQDLQNIAAGSYIMLLTDGNGCVYDTTFILSQPVQPLVVQTTQVNLFCQNGNNGFVNLTVSGGVQPYTYQWSNGAITQDIFNLTAGTYSVIITDVNSCQVYDMVNITQPAIPFELTGLVGNVSCFGASTGTIDLNISGGNSSFTYIWSNGATTQDINNLTVGNYNVVVYDAQGCQASQSFVISQPLFALQASALVSSLNCASFETGSIDISVYGGVAPYTYQWSTGAISEDLSNLGAGSYSVTITDINGCQIVLSESLSAPTEPLVTTAVVQNVSCFGLSDGEITLNTSGGVGPYAVSWSNGLSSATIDSLSAGIYDVVVTDSNGCQNELNIQVIQPPSIVSFFYSSSEFACIPDTINFSYPMTDPNLSFIWDFGNGQTSTLQNPSIVFDDLGCFTVSLTINSNNGCSVQIVSDSLICTVQGPSAAFYSTNTTIDFYTGELQLFDNSEGSIDSYLWSFGDASPNSIEMNPNHYYTPYDQQSYLVQLTVTDSNGCFDTAEFLYDLFEDFNVYVPNTITVNGDQFNEGFFPVFSNIDILKSYQIEIFNRWGQLVWFSDQPAEPWYGRYNNSSDVQIGAYSWKIKYTDNKSVTRTIAGHLNVIR